jgi:hypothetical protein
MNSGLANMLGRPELSPTYGAVVVTSDGSAMPVVSGGSSGMFQASASNTLSGDVSVGQTALGLVAAGIVALGLLYLWTRGAQR